MRRWTVSCFFSGKEWTGECRLIHLPWRPGLYKLNIFSLKFSATQLVTHCQSRLKYLWDLSWWGIECYVVFINILRLIVLTHSALFHKILSFLTKQMNAKTKTINRSNLGTIQIKLWQRILCLSWYSTITHVEYKISSYVWQLVQNRNLDPLYSVW